MVRAACRLQPPLPFSSSSHFWWNAQRNSWQDVDRHISATISAFSLSENVSFWDYICFSLLFFRLHRTASLCSFTPPLSFHFSDFWGQKLSAFYGWHSHRKRPQKAAFQSEMNRQACIVTSFSAICCAFQPRHRVRQRLRRPRRAFSRQALRLRFRMRRHAGYAASFQLVSSATGCPEH